MYSNNILNFQESMTILNACTKKSGNLWNEPRISLYLLLIFILTKISYIGVRQNNGNTWKSPPQCNPPLKYCYEQLPSYSFWRNWILEMVIKLCYNFRSCILEILPNNRCKSPTVPVRQLSLFFQSFSFVRKFSFFLKCCYYFWDSTPRYTEYFSRFCNSSTCHTITTNLISFKAW